MTVLYSLGGGVTSRRTAGGDASRRGSAGDAVRALGGEETTFFLFCGGLGSGLLAYGHKVLSNQFFLKSNRKL